MSVKAALIGSEVGRSTTHLSVKTISKKASGDYFLRKFVRRADLSKHIRRMKKRDGALLFPTPHRLVLAHVPSFPPYHKAS